MEIAGYEFGYIGDIAPLQNSDGSIQQCTPQVRYQNPRGVALNTYGQGPFCRFKIPRHHQSSGVYVLAIDAEIRYVGECANLSARFNNGYGNISPKNCFKGGQETNCRLNNLIYSEAAAGKKISLFFHHTTDYKALEVALRAALKAPWNRV